MTSQNTNGGEAPQTGLLSEMADTANLKAIVFLSIAMTAFAFDDMFIKLASAEIGVGQILSIQSLLALAYFAWLARVKGHRLTREALFSRAVLIRNAGEATGAVCFVIALSLMPISNASAILQAAPLAVTLGAAVILRETVGWRRWVAVVAGFAGVLLVMRPGLAGFNAASLFAVAAVFGLALRDLYTRAVPRSIPTEIIALISNAVVLTVSVILQTATSPWSLMSSYATAMVLCASFFGIIAIHLVTIALRIGEVSVLAPFRYVRVVIAIGVGVVVFGERPDMYTWIGTGLIVAGGLYALYREQIVGNRKRNDL
jgi:drug/metabolite transporter (DMT)-like permease